jgi:hypothetical protein
MTTPSEFRNKYPQYDDLSDSELADSLHEKFYSDIPRSEFMQKIESPQQDMALAASDGGTGMDEGLMRSALRGSTVGLGEHMVVLVPVPCLVVFIPPQPVATRMRLPDQPL